ncbi:MAG: VOC family protein [Nocardioidaceae bacterium]
MSVVVRPVRFTDNVDSMRAFLITLGLQPRVESVSGGWVDMVAGGGASPGGGMVALHSARDSARQAPSGLTSLSFEAGDVDVLAKRLGAAGVPDVTVYDEAYGRVLSCRDPLGDEIAVDERSTDLYGYRVNESGHAKAGWQVLAARFTDPLGPYGAFLEALGMQRRGGSSAHFAAYGFSGGAHGAVGLHPPTDKAGPHLDEPGAIRLSFQTTEPLAAVAARLEANRVPVLQRQEAFGFVLEISDPDGIAVEVFAAPEASA